MADIILKPTDWNIQAAKYNVKPGDRLILEGDRAEIELHDLVGTPDKPIILTAKSPVTLKGVNPGGRGVIWSNCKNVRITGDPNGTGDMNLTLINIGQGVDFRDLSTGVEADHLTIRAGYLGLAAKTDPTCDPKTWRGNFILDGVYFHHNDISTETGEGIYIGESHYQTTVAPIGGPCASGTKAVQEHEVKNVVVEDNIIRTSGADGIQVGSCPTGAIIRRNNVLKYGTAKVYGQTAGIIANPGTVAQVYENWIDTGIGFAIQLQGPGGSVVRNNVILNAGSADQGGGIMQVNYIPNGKVDQIYNNTFINTRRVGVEYYNLVEFKNNILNTITGAAFYKQGGSSGKITKTGNIELAGNPEQLKLDANYTPTASSPAYAADVTSADIGAITATKVTKTVSPALIEKEVTNGVVKYYLTTESGYRKLLE